MHSKLRTTVQRYFIYLAYNGANYHGWQIQPNANSVQQTIEEALSTILREKISIVGAGRTDTGVNASMMVAHFDFEKSIPDCVQLVYKLDKLLPKDIAIYKIIPVAPDMHARFSALSRTYKYYVTTRKDPFAGIFKNKVHGEIDVEKMNEAAKVLFDYIDFTSFSRLHTDVKTNNCKIMYAQWDVEQNGDLVFTIQADRFLRNMVRAVVGTLLLIGRGKLTINDLRTIIEQKDRCKADESAKAEVLFLTTIEYPELP